MSSPQKLYEGKAKILYTTDDPSKLLAHFKDDATAFNAQKKGQIIGKGEINCAIATELFRLLEAKGITTHFIEQPAANQMLIKRTQILPLEVVVRNIAAGSLCQQTGLPMGTLLPKPLVEFYFKNDALGDPLLTRDRLLLLKLATPEQLDELNQQALRINQILQAFFHQCRITLVDFKLEFGLTPTQELILADEISPDTCRLWNQTETDPQGRVMDKDRFRHDLGKVEDAYKQVLARIVALKQELEKDN
ncbi:MAG: phosphoribosylaminoimidazolesuccinocarboxamide synthase [Symploca sp. SIO3C6]|uniref:Phosphoribosylaminoimidazole-succinocarboxamide synthase n=1 Tax=Symploca sp. SIO1C4 TaxID=2607765 RepID=A0A6B3N7V0_9CYAN|nr:phosphoribosylaminoimidazolesuccinocarboxamide synthase [Symploca sp. SIO3C6]NER26905.1 phosphoribosylaminoimidazolesuccinocarboxamide synthase [Symploca sp. SIO1C4]NET07169.1 phosphoribosylaminoimidazolesuccinocarboxamide synthase [Symploca sp. SIO2B6]